MVAPARARLFLCLNLMDIVITAALILFLAWRELLSYRERDKLVDRLMAKNLPEYKDNAAPEPNHVEPDPDESMDLDAAKEELMYGQEEN